MRRAISAAVIVALAAAAVWAVALARADAAFRDGRVEQAVALMPGNAAYVYEAALREEYEGRDAASLLRRAAELNPTASAPRIRLGLLAEQRGDAAEAERWLRGSYDVDRQFETRWTLANFYLRQDRPEEFWTWIRSALEVSYGDRRPAFDLCWRMSGDAREIQRRAIPDREEVAASYLGYLMDRRQWDALAAAAEQVRTPAMLLGATDALLASGRYRDAAAVWRWLGRAEPRGITGPAFEEPRTGQGFDWRTVPGEGITHLPLDGGRGHRIRLNGSQAETADLLRQYAGGLQAGSRYRLTWQADGVIPGLQWWVDGKPGETFVAQAEVALLTLRYQRPRGEMRAEGAIDIRRVSVEPE